jgi:hypothetical protein
MNSAIVRTSLRFRLELPVHCWHSIDERTADAEERAGRSRAQHGLPNLVENTGLDDCNREARFCEADADSIAGSTSANHYIVVPTQIVRGRQQLNLVHRPLTSGLLRGYRQDHLAHLERCPGPIR